MKPMLQNEDQQQQVVREIFSLLSKRSDAVCNFLEGGRCAPRTRRQCFEIDESDLLWREH